MRRGEGLRAHHASRPKAAGRGPRPLSNSGREKVVEDALKHSLSKPNHMICVYVRASEAIMLVKLK